MKASALLQKVKSLRFPALPRKKLFLGLGGLAVVIALTMGLRVGFKGGPSGSASSGADSHTQAAASVERSPANLSGHATEHAPRGFWAGAWGAYKDAWGGVQATVDRLRRADSENERLRLENAHLRLKLEARQFECHAGDAERATRGLELQLDRETGSRMGRTLASIGYKPPLHLLPPQLFALAASYFKAREDEKAAVLLTFLTGLEDDDTYKTARDYLMTGIAWYRLDNFSAAESYFDRAKEKADAQEGKQLQSQSRLWKALVAERLGKHDGAQRWLRDVLDRDPHSTEAAWVNSDGRGKPSAPKNRNKEVERVPAQSQEH
ncbi:MAG: hypothetical protein NDJ89_15620 [Oligoflexia bacterium]|nr:hypothetical protein [Oligoflexia bacterium]